MRRGRILRWLLVGLIAVMVVGVVGFLWYAQPQPLLPEATAALASTDRATYTAGADGRITYTPTAAPPAVGLVLYPGGKVPPAAYAPQARAIAEAGYLVVIVPVPFNLAVFDIDAAQRVIDDHPEIQAWAVGGHSLGGSMAAQFAAGHVGTVQGLVLWASYSAADVSPQGLHVLSIHGTLDAGLASYTSPEHLALLGPAIAVVPIEGGNHEQMGWYTGQPNDPPATIGRAEQQAVVVSATIQLLVSLGPPPGPWPPA